MKLVQIEIAEAEALRFLDKLKDHKERLQKDKYYVTHLGVGYKETGALRRSSMDLTRALADMRKS